MHSKNIRLFGRRAVKLHFGVQPARSQPRRRRTCHRLIGLDSFWLSPTPTIPGSRYEEQSQCPRICQCLTLKYHNTFFRIYNIHLDHKGDLARQLGMEATLRRVGEDLTRDKLPFFVLGDFNCKPDESPIALCMNNSYAEMKELTDAIKHTFHNYGRIESDHKIDYIFSDPNTARLLDSVSAWTDEHHGIYLSDHYPLAVEIQF